METDRQTERLSNPTVHAPKVNNYTYTNLIIMISVGQLIKLPTGLTTCKEQGISPDSFLPCAEVSGHYDIPSRPYRPLIP